MDKKKVFIGSISIILGGIILYFWFFSVHPLTPERLQKKLVKLGYANEDEVFYFDKNDEMDLGVLGNTKARIGKLMCDFGNDWSIFFEDYESRKIADKYMLKSLEDEDCKLISQKDNINSTRCEYLHNSDRYIFEVKTKKTYLSLSGPSSDKSKMIELLSKLGYYK